MPSGGFYTTPHRHSFDAGSEYSPKVGGNRVGGEKILGSDLISDSSPDEKKIRIGTDQK